MSWDNSQTYRRRTPYRPLSRRRSSDRAVWVVTGVVVVALFTWLIVWAINDRHRWEDHCRQDLHGHVAHHTSYGYKSSSTTYWCLSSDGRILDIK